MGIKISIIYCHSLSHADPLFAVKLDVRLLALVLHTVSVFNVLVVDFSFNTN